MGKAPTRTIRLLDKLTDAEAKLGRFLLSHTDLVYGWESIDW